jgi:hypothetical protein
LLQGNYMDELPQDSQATEVMEDVLEEYDSQATEEFLLSNSEEDHSSSSEPVVGNYMDELTQANEARVKDIAPPVNGNGATLKRNPEDIEPDATRTGARFEEHVTNLLREQDLHRKQQEPMKAASAGEGPSDMALSDLPQETMARVCSTLIQSMSPWHRQAILGPRQDIPPMLLASRLTLLFLKDPGNRQTPFLERTDYSQTQTLLLDELCLPKGSPPFQAAMITTPAEATLQGHFVASLRRDMRGVDVDKLISDLNRCDYSTGSQPVCHWSTPEDTRLIQEHLLKEFGITEHSYHTMYSFVLLDAIKNLRIFHFFQLSKRAARHLANLSGASRKMHLSFAPAVKFVFEREFTRHEQVLDLLRDQTDEIQFLPTDHPSYPATWDVPRSWEMFCGTLSEHEEGWITFHTFSRLVQAMRITARADIPL